MEEERWYKVDMKSLKSQHLHTTNALKENCQFYFVALERALNDVKL
jgi:hypothetical protein